MAKKWQEKEKRNKRRNGSLEKESAEEWLTVEELLGEQLTGESAEEDVRFTWLVIKSLSRLEELLGRDLTACLGHSLPEVRALVLFHQHSFLTRPFDNYLAQIVAWILARKTTGLSVNPFKERVGAEFFKELSLVKSPKLLIWTIWRLEEFLESFSEAQNKLTEERE